MTKYYYYIDVLLKLLATTFLLDTIKIELYKNYFFRWSNETTIRSKKLRVKKKKSGLKHMQVQEKLGNSRQK